MLKNVKAAAGLPHSISDGARAEARPLERQHAASTSDLAEMGRSMLRPYKKASGTGAAGRPTGRLLEMVQL
jgi:hypothetical protein